MVNASLRNSAIGESRGYTLVELLVVLALLSLLAGLTIPRFHQSSGRSHLRQAAQQLARDLTTGRLLAIDHGCNYVVRHQPIGSRYAILPQHQVSLQSTSQGDLTPPATDAQERDIDPPAPARAETADSATRVTQLRPSIQQRALTQQRTYDDSINEELPTDVVFAGADMADFQQGAPTPNARPNLASRTMPSSAVDEEKAAFPTQDLLNLSWKNALVFYPDGRSESGEVTLQAANGDVVRLTIRGLTGGVTIGPIERPAPQIVAQQTPSRTPADTATFATPTRDESNNAR